MSKCEKLVIWILIVIGLVTVNCSLAGSNSANVLVGRVGQTLKITPAESNAPTLIHFNESDFYDDGWGNKISNYGVSFDNDPCKFGAGSAYFDGNSNSCTKLTISASPNFDFGTSDFTIDFWVYPLTVTSEDGLFKISANYWGSNGLAMLIYNSHFYRKITTYADANSFGDSLAPNTWYHVAVVRNGNNLHWFVDGILQETDDVTGLSFGDSTTEFTIGVYYNDETYGDSLYGYIDEFRISKGTACWTSDFDTPTTEYANPSVTVQWSN